MHRFLGVPVTTGDGQVFGNLYLTDPLDGEPFSEEDEHLVEAFGRAAGLVIDQATLRSQLRELTLSEERERLARDLHDTVIQRLFGVWAGPADIALVGRSTTTCASAINNVLDELDTTIQRDPHDHLRDRPGATTRAARSERAHQPLADEVAQRASGSTST